MAFFNKERVVFGLANIGAAIVLAIIIIWGITIWLNSYTDHGETISVPNLRDLSMEEARDLLAKKGLRVLLIDSLYDKDSKPGVIVEQYPVVNAYVKANRMIQVIINAKVPEQVKLPKLKESPYRQTIQTLRILGFEIGKIRYERSQFKNLVLDLECEGRMLEMGDVLPKGETINIVLGDGNDSYNLVSYPKLVGKTLEEALSLIQENYLNVGEVISDNTVKTAAERATAVVYEQTPNGNTGAVQAASSVNLRITNDASVIKDALQVKVDTTEKATLADSLALSSELSHTTL